MAIRYVKDFEFPSKAGYTKSATKVTGQMYAKGGSVKKDAPKGVMVVIGVGKPAKGPVRKAAGDDASNYNASGYDFAKLAEMAGEANATTEAEKIMSGRGAMTDSESRALANARATSKAKDAASKKKGSRYIPGSNIPHGAIRDQGEQAASEAGSGALSDSEKRAMGPQYYAKGGKAEKKITKVMREYKAGELHSGSKKGPKVTNPKQAIAIALSEAGKSKKMAKGGKVSHMEWEHSKEDLAQDKKLAKKHGMSLEKWEKSALDKKHDKQQSPKGLRKGGACYADGGMAAAPVSPLQRMGLAAKRPSMERAKGVPVAPRAPVIAPPSMGQRGVGVNAKRPGGPDVGALKAAMAKAASQAMPQNAPSMMKKGGKVK